MASHVKHIPCPKCGSKDNLSVYKDGTGWCFGCETYFKEAEKGEGMTESVVNRDEYKPRHTIDFIKDNFEHKGFSERKISPIIDKFYEVLTEVDQRTGLTRARYYPRTDSGETVGYKIRELPKSFGGVGDCKTTEFFGQHKFSSGKRLVITEGEEDALALKQAFLNCKYKVCAVSMPDGAKNIKCFEQNLEWLEKFESVILCLDNDRDGKEATKKAVKYLTPGKVYVAKLPVKDACEMLKAGRDRELCEAIWNAEQVIPGGIVNGKDTWEALQDSTSKECVPYFAGCEVLNEKTKGIRFGEISLYTAGTGVGKTSFFKELEYYLINNRPENVGIIHLEETLGDSVRDLMSIHMNKRIHLWDKAIPETEMRNAHQHLFDSGRVEFVDHFASLDSEDLIHKIKYLAIGKGCRFIFLDHISIAVSEFAQGGSEREAIDTLMTKLTKVVTNLDIWIGIISHLRKTGTEGKSFELGAIPTLDDLRGSGGLKQMTWDVIALSRDQQSEDPMERNLNYLHVLKCRHTGDTGPAGALMFNPKTGRMNKLDLSDREF